MGTLRKKVSIDASAQADIAFLLLIFYLVATTISNDYGILRKLPPENTEPQTSEIHKRNVIEILVNEKGEMLFENQLLPLSDLSEALRVQIINEHNASMMPEIIQLEDPNYGVYSRTKHVISLQNHRGTKYTDYIQVQDQILATYNTLRNETSQREFGVSFDVLKEQSKTDPEALSRLIFIKKLVPQRISEADPVAVR